MAEFRRRVTNTRTVPAVPPSPVASGKRRLIGKQQPDPLRRLFNEWNHPGLKRFKQALQRQNVSFTNAQVSDIVKGSAARQIFAPRQRVVGKVTSTAPDARWAADMLVFTSTPAREASGSFSQRKTSGVERYTRWLQHRTILPQSLLPFALS